VTYKELSAAQTRLSNKRKKAAKKGDGGKVAGAKVKGWMLQHVRTVGEEQTLSEAETILLEGDVGVIPVVEGRGGGGEGREKVKGLITRTDMLRQHQYYDTLHYNNKAFADKIADRKGIVALRKKLKAMDMED
jgi:CBS-domain-containing membrane protein